MDCIDHYDPVRGCSTCPETFVGVMADRDDLQQQLVASSAQVAALRAALADAQHGLTVLLNDKPEIPGWAMMLMERVTAALALTDAQAGARWAALERLAELVDAHADCYTHAEVRAALFALAALDGGRQGPQ